MPIAGGVLAALTGDLVTALNTEILVPLFQFPNVDGEVWARTIARPQLIVAGRSIFLLMMFHPSKGGSSGAFVLQILIFFSKTENIIFKTWKFIRGYNIRNAYVAFKYFEKRRDFWKVRGGSCSLRTVLISAIRCSTVPPDKVQCRTRRRTTRGYTEKLLRLSGR